MRPENQRGLEDRLRDGVRQGNRRGVRPEARPPTFDVVGNPISPSMPRVRRDGVSRVSMSFSRVRAKFGDPGFTFVITPRSRLDYWDGYWGRSVDGHWASRHRKHHTVVVINFYYPYYYADPYWSAFYYPGYYPSIYHYWGWCPGWVYPSRVYYRAPEYVYAPATPYRYYGAGAYPDELATRRVLEDVREAWFYSDISSLAYHMTDELDIRVYFDGEYSYTTTTEDYHAMTLDAMATTQTVALDFERPIWLSAYEFFVTGRHEFWDADGKAETVYVSYRFRRLGSEWYLVAVGSSLDPIRHAYRDYRH